MTNNDRSLNSCVENALGDDLKVHDFGPINFSNDRANKRLWRAVEDWLKRGDSRTMDYAAWYWNNREGTPWQVDIEKFVHAYHADPRPFTADIELCMTVLVPAIQAMGHPVEIKCAPVDNEHGDRRWAGVGYDAGTLHDRARYLVKVGYPSMVPTDFYAQGYDDELPRAIVKAFLATKAQQAEPS